MTGDALDLDKLRALAEGVRRANRAWPADYNAEYSVCDRTESAVVHDFVDALSPQTLLALLDAHAAAVRDRDAAVQERDELRAVVERVRDHVDAIRNAWPRGEIAARVAREFNQILGADL